MTQVDLIEQEPIAAADVFGAGIELVRRYVRALASDGMVRGLIGPRETGRLWSRHVLNSAVAQTLLVAGSDVVDIGSGAGLPGIPLAIARPDCNFTLVEPLERRTVFLQEIVDILQLNNCRVLRGRADQMVTECGQVDVATSRAVAPLAKLAAWSAPLLRPGGEMLALKGSSAAAEITRDSAAAAAAGLFDLEVITVGLGIVDPVTSIIRGRMLPVNTRDPQRRASDGAKRIRRRK